MCAYFFRLLYNLRKSWDSKEEEELRKWEKNMDLLLQKGKEYQDRIMKLEVITNMQTNFTIKIFPNLI